MEDANWPLTVDGIDGTDESASCRYYSNLFMCSGRSKINTQKQKGWGLSAKLGKHSAFWGKLGTALQAYTLNPCTKFPPNPTSRKVNT